MTESRFLQSPIPSPHRHDALTIRKTTTTITVVIIIIIFSHPCRHYHYQTTSKFATETLAAHLKPTGSYQASRGGCKENEEKEKIQDYKSSNT